MYMLNGWWFLSSGGAYPPVFTVIALATPVPPKPSGSHAGLPQCPQQIP